MSTMWDEIHEQPQAIEHTLEREHASISALVREIQAREIRHIAIAARGTSDNAATYAKYLFEILVGVPVSLAAPSVYTLYDGKINLSDSLMLGISQSGEATDVVQTLSMARATGALTACITNVTDSPMTQVSDHVLLCQAGKERSVAATKTYTTSLALVAMLAGHWVNHTEILEELRAVPEMIRTTLYLDEDIEEMAERYRYMSECAVLARGLNLPTALEAALKMTETSYLVAKPYSGADFQHGPIAMISEGFPCFMFIPDGRAYPSMVELALKLKERQAEIVIVAHSSEALDLATRKVPIHSEISELLSPLLYIVPGQLWAYHLARARGKDPDRPRGLSKVTRTR